MIREWFYRPVHAGDDSTVAEFVDRHYGREMVERLADPLLAGVYGGGADELSVRSVLPRFAEIEATHGSLGRGMIAARERQASGSARPLFTSLKDGMQQMVDGLLARIPASARRENIAVDTVKAESGKWLVVSSGRTEEFDAVIIATPAYVAAEMLAHGNAELAAELSGIRYSSSVTAILAFDQNVRATLPPGFGFLVPRSEGRRMLAATFVHNKFAHRAPENRALIRCFLGGTRDDAILHCSEDEILRIVQRELREILGITAEPLFNRIYKWKRAMAQYGLGHGERVERIKKLVSQKPGLTLAGNAYNGIGVPDCVRSGSEAAAEILAQITTASASC
jgi:oxygen-dependent protoporphyrinogen oxidase